VFQDFDTSTTPWLNPLAGQNLRIAVTGALAFNVTIFIPANVPGMWLIDNQTSGGYYVTILTTAAGSNGISAPQGYMSYIFSDGTNIRYADEGNAVANGANPPGTIISFGGVNAPSGYLPCLGGAYLIASYPRLYAAIGSYWNTTTIPADQFQVPNLYDMFIRGSGSQQVGTFEDQMFAQHDHPINDPGHKHPVWWSQATSGTPAGGFLGGNQPTPGDTYQTTLNASSNVSVGLNGGSETRPKNKRVLFCIKT
jgi:hypothetical protein